MCYTSPLAPPPRRHGDSNQITIAFSCGTFLTVCSDLPMCRDKGSSDAARVSSILEIVSENENDRRIPKTRQMAVHRRWRYW